MRIYVSKEFLSTVLKFGAIPMLSSLLVMINYSVDIIFLKRMGSSEELSYYALAANIVNYVWLVPDSFKEVLFSKSARTFDRHNIKISSQLSCLFIMVCFVGFALAGKFILRFVYGNEFVNSYLVTLILILGAASMSMFKIVGIVLISQGKRMAHFVSLAISATVNVILNTVLIPRIGMYGAALASVCSYSVCAFALVSFFCKTYAMSVRELIIIDSNTISILKKIIPKKCG